MHKASASTQVLLLVVYLFEEHQKVMFSNQMEDGCHDLPQRVDLRCGEAERAAGRNVGAVVAAITIRRSRDAALAGVMVVCRVA